jgi:hypothetical protein
VRLDELFPFPAERTASSDEFFAALGRAVTFCALFERNCAAAAWSVEREALRQASDESVPRNASSTSLSPAAAVELGRALLAKPVLARHLEKIANWLKRPIDWVEVFELPRQARNAIVHEIARGIVRDVESATGRAARLAELRERIRWVVLADLGVCLLVQTLAREELPPLEFTETYASRIVSWVCDAETSYSGARTPPARWRDSARCARTYSSSATVTTAASRLEAGGEIDAWTVATPAALAASSDRVADTLFCLTAIPGER